MIQEKLEEAKRLYETANADQKYVLESLFPELRESEDEKIRKNLIQYFNTFTLDTFAGLDPKKILDWLEKQGKLLNESVYDTEDKEMYQAIAIGLTDMLDGYGWSDFGGISIKNILNWLEKQGK